MVEKSYECIRTLSADDCRKSNCVHSDCCSAFKSGDFVPEMRGGWERSYGKLRVSLYCGDYQPKAKQFSANENQIPLSFEGKEPQE